MDREILFRGKRTDNGEWVEGFYCCMVHDDGRHAHHFIIPLGADLSLGTPIEKIQVEVDPETICQYTGLTDKKQQKIFDGDIVKHYNNDEHPERFDIGTILWDKKDCGFYRSRKESDFCNIDRCCVYEVIGNVFDNPEVEKPKCDKCKCRDCFSRSECCPECEGAILRCEEFSETDIYKPDLLEGGAE